MEERWIWEELGGRGGEYDQNIIYDILKNEKIHLKMYGSTVSQSNCYN